tara:strand:+ start:94 stop:933 length:840 start_codon:yes stop_codon:yes gene_type:complete
MKFIFTFFLFVLLFFLSGCGNKKKETIILDSKDLESQMVEAYNEGLKALEEGDILFAAKNFNIVENIYPQSIWAPRSVLMAAYSYYTQDYYGDAISELNRFIKNYPENDSTPYAYFLLATCYYELIVDEKKDLSSIIKSKEYYNLIIKKYPNTDFSLDAKFKLLLINSILASKEIYLGKYYLSKKKWIPAMNRFKNVIDDYEETDYVEEAIHRLVEINYILGLEEEAKKYAVLLGYNYQSSKWYKESYKVFNKKYENPQQKIKKEKGSKIIKRFKKLFD